MTQLVMEVREDPELGFVARALGAAIFSEADTIEQLREQVRDAVRCHFEPGTEPKFIGLVFVREEVIAA